MEQKPVNFSIVKEKIIKTDEVLKLLKTSQHECKEWKSKYKQSVLTLKTSQLEINRHSSNTEALNVKLKLLEKDNISLREQNSYLEERCNKQMIDSMQTIKDLQDELQILQELKVGVSKDKKDVLPITDVDNLKEENKSLSIRVSELTKQNTCLEEEKSNVIKDLLSKNEDFIEEIKALKSQVDFTNENHKKDKDEMEKRISYLSKIKENHNQLLQENKLLVVKLATTETELEQWKNNKQNKHNQEVYQQLNNPIEKAPSKDLNYYKSIISEFNNLEKSQNLGDMSNPEVKENYKHLQMEIMDFKDELATFLKDLRIINNLEIQNVRSMSVQTDIQCSNQENQYLVENKKISQKLQDYEKTIEMLKKQINLSKVDVFSQTESADSAIDSDFETENVFDMLNEMLIVPRLVSPFSPVENSMDTQSSSLPNIPSIVVTPSTPTFNKDIFLSDYSYPRKDQADVDIKVDNQSPKVNSPSKVQSDMEKSPLISRKFKRSKKKSCFTYNDFIRQQSWSLRHRKLALKKRLNMKKRKIQQTKDTFLDSLKALKESNINFTISNDAATSHYSIYDIPGFNYNISTISRLSNLSAPFPQVIENLTCCLKNCNQKCMLLNETSTETQLLGFLNIKSEVKTPTEFQTEHPLENKPPDPSKSLPSNAIIEQIADIVCERLKSEGVSVKKPKPLRSISISEHSDSLLSETETEIERLFRKPGVDILRQNKLLWEEARQNRRQTSTDDSCQSRADDNSSEVRSDTVSITGDYSSVCSESSLRFRPYATVSSSESDKTIPRKDSFDSFKIPMCPKLLSPICSISSVDVDKSPSYFSSPLISVCPQLLSPVYSSPAMSSRAVRNLSFNSEQNFSNNSNVSFYINKLLENQQSITQNVDKFLCSFPTQELISTSPLKQTCSNDKNPSAQNDKIGNLHYLDHTRDSSSGFIDIFEEQKKNSPELLKASELKDDESKKHGVPGVNTIQNLKARLIRTSLKCVNKTNTDFPSKFIGLFEEQRGKPEILKSCQVNTEEFTKPCFTEKNHISAVKKNQKLSLISVNDNICNSHGGKNNYLSKSVEQMQLEDTKTNKIVTSPQTLRRSKRNRRESLTNVLKRKRLKTSALITSESEENSLESPLCPIFDRRLHNDCEERNKDETSNCGIVTERAVEGVDISSEKKKSPKSLDVSSRTIRTNIRKRKPVSKLQSNVFQQMKLKKQMIETKKTFNVVNCDNLGTKQHRIGNSLSETSQNFIFTNSKGGGDSTKQVARKSNNNSEDLQLNTKPDKTISERTKLSHKKKLSKKINIVQNILIPPNSKHVIDLLENIRKPKNIGPSEDIVSEILDSMDRDKPKVITRDEVITKVQKGIADSINDRQFRGNVLEIAEVLYSGIRNDCKSDTTSTRCQSVMESVILQKGKTLPRQMKILLMTLYQCLSKGTIRDDVIHEFKKLSMEVIADIVIVQVGKNFHEKPTEQYFNAPFLTETQKLFLCLMLRLENEEYSEMTNTFLQRSEHYLLFRGCNIKMARPIVRLHMTICRLRGDITRVRKFLQDAFYHIGEAAVPLCFTILTNWVEVMPKWDSWQTFPVSKVIFQVIHLHECNKQGYNLFPLKCLLAQYYGFPKERLNCDELFEELYQNYLREPMYETEFAMRLLCKHKPKPWLYQKINQFFKPLVYKIPSENINFKATVIILTGKLCQFFRPKYPAEEEYLNELKRWFSGIVEDGAPKLISESVEYVIEKLPKKKYNKKKSKNKTSPKKT